MHWRLLSGVPEGEVRRLLSAARRRSFRRGAIVIHRGDPGDAFHLVVRGRFKVLVMTPLGDEATMAIRGPGDCFGELALLDPDARRSATVEALEESETFSVSEAEFRRLRHDHPGVDQALIAFLADAVRSQNERLLEAYYVGAETRVRRRLVELAGVYGDGREQVVIPLSQQEIAGLAGTSRSTVNLALRAEQAAGTIELGRAKTIIVDLTGLSDRAH